MGNKLPYIYRKPNKAGSTPILLVFLTPVAGHIIGFLYWVVRLIATILFGGGEYAGIKILTLYPMQAVVIGMIMAGVLSIPTFIFVLKQKMELDSNRAASFFEPTYLEKLKSQGLIALVLASVYMVLSLLIAIFYGVGSMKLFFG
ncbi:hypothetical protein [Butyrivibrio proteoclasticus]|uniref:hypothetical protein n=1 Tax=Butyrivibrio proteoclasticus TaxID=43305 RepID=UPI00047D2ED1|nr:hypothetical protein [Butyrivibrio proteoclasticus]